MGLSNFLPLWVLALSIYSPENLASLLEDKEKQDNSDIIAQFKRGELNQAIN